MNVRAVAARALVPVVMQKSSLDSAFIEAEKSLETKDLPLLKELCFGVSRHYFSLEALLNTLLSKPLKAKDKDIHCLVLLGIYQLWHMRVPNHAAINETVNATKTLKKKWATGLVNGLLRRFLREQEQLTSDVNNSDAQYNHPQWLLKKLRKAWPDNWQAIVEGNNTQAPFTLRINQQVNSRSEFEGLLSAQECEYTLSEHSPQGLTLAKATDVHQLPGFADGSCSVQDEAAQLSAALLALAPGQRVLDACCAPGGKTCHIAETEPALSELVAIDLEAPRLVRVEENLARLKLNATIKCAPAQALDQWWDGKHFDRILLDAPCSATGVIRRHPDIKLLRRASDIQQLSQLQAEILREIWKTLAPEGILVYATCSVLPDENEKIVAAFVEEQADAIHLPIEASWGHERPAGRQLFPVTNGHDGFYYARLKKIG